MGRQGLSTESELRLASLQWTLENPKVNTICPSMPDFDLIEKTLPVSGATLTAQQAGVLHSCQSALQHHYCRHGCRACVSACPENLSVSTIMRYSYYYALQRREKYAMERYAALGPKNAELCLSCHAPCADACPYGVDVQANLVGAHTLLTLA
jgi:ferredoxin